MGLRVFDDRELAASDRILRHVDRGGVAVLKGRWERVLQLRERLLRRCRDREILARLTLRASGDWVRSVEPPQHVPYLSLIAGAGAGEYLVPLEDLLSSLTAQERLHTVDSLGASLVVHQNVHVPRSQPLIHLLRRAMEAMASDLVAAPARNRAETALNDAGQATVSRFLHQAPYHLNPGGRVLLGYANHSGEKAMANLERFIAEAGLSIRYRHSDRIKTHRSNRAWQAIYAYDLAGC